MFMGLLHHRMHKLNSGLVNSNVVERLEKTKPGLDGHQMPPMKKCVTKYSDRRVKVEDIANALHISHVSVSTILHDRLGMRKLTARWVPKSLSNEQMATRASVCSALLKRFRSKEDGFLSRLVTVDETWVHYYEPENKAQSHQWVGLGSPKKFKTQPSAHKVMATVFWDAQGVITLDFLAKKSTITGAYCENLPDQLQSVKSAEVNSPKGFCSDRTMRESTLAKLQWMLLSGMGRS